MTPNGPKIREAILHVIRTSDLKQTRVTQFEIAKSLFLADRAHLNRYGRPITFDKYVAMNNGPVPSFAYNVLKQEHGAYRDAGITKPLWQHEPIGGGKCEYYGASRDASDEILSPTDFEELANGLQTVQKLGITGTWKLVHQDPAYLEAWPKGAGGNSSYPMKYALLFDKPNEELAEELKFISAHA